MMAAVALMIATLVLGALVSSCARGERPTSTAIACAFVDHYRNPALTPGGGA